jgi:hypothetical protein
VLGDGRVEQEALHASAAVSVELDAVIAGGEAGAAADAAEASVGSGAHIGPVDHPACQGTAAVREGTAVADSLGEDPDTAFVAVASDAA